MIQKHEKALGKRRGLHARRCYYYGESEENEKRQQQGTKQENGRSNKKRESPGRGGSCVLHARVAMAAAPLSRARRARRPFARR